MRYLLPIMLLLAAPVLAEEEVEVCREQHQPPTEQELNEMAICVQNKLASTNVATDNRNLMECYRNQINAMSSCGINSSAPECNMNQLAHDCATPAMPTMSQQQASEQCYAEMVARRAQSCDTANNKVRECQKTYEEDKRKCDATYDALMKVSQDSDNLPDDFYQKANDEYQKCLDEAREKYRGCAD